MERGQKEATHRQKMHRVTQVMLGPTDIPEAKPADEQCPLQEEEHVILQAKMTGHAELCVPMPCTASRAPGPPSKEQSSI